MGGKGGGGGASYQDSMNTVMGDPGLSGQFRQQFEATKPQYASEADWYANYGLAPDPGRPVGSDPKFSKEIFTKMFGTYQPPPAAAAPAPAPEAAAPAPEAPAPEAPAPETPSGDPIDPGGAIDQPGLGSELGGAILNPPAYWIGGQDSYSKAKGTGGTKGSLTTTQT